MKPTFIIASVLLAASPAFAGLIPANGVLPGSPPPNRRDTRQALGVLERAVCNEDNVLRALMNPTRSAGASTFCSAYLQPTTTITSTATVSQTSVITATTVITTSTTTVATQTSIATTVLCPATPASTATTTCNYPAYGFNTYLISSRPNTDPFTCHQLCLQVANCQSFQVQSGGQQFCNLYNQPTLNYVFYAPNDVYTFFDRDCPNYVPAACTPDSAAPAGKRDIAARDVTTPANLSTVLATVPATRISSACSCLITSPSATATVTIPTSAIALTTMSTTVTITTTGTEVDSTTVTVTATMQASP